MQRGAFIMPIANALQVTPTKESYVEKWRLLETYRGDRHLVGRFSSTGRYWASPPIVRLDFAPRKGFTSDGRQYLLVGEPGAAAEAEYFVSLCAAFDERLLTTRDVTGEFLSHAMKTRTGRGEPSRFGQSYLRCAVIEGDPRDEPSYEEA